MSRGVPSNHGPPRPPPPSSSRPSPGSKSGFMAGAAGLWAVRGAAPARARCPQPDRVLAWHPLAGQGAEEADVGVRQSNVPQPSPRNFRQTSPMSQREVLHPQSMRDGSISQKATTWVQDVRQRKWEVPVHVDVDFVKPIYQVRAWGSLRPLGQREGSSRPSPPPRSRRRRRS